MKYSTAALTAILVLATSVSALPAPTDGFKIAHAKVPKDHPHMGPFADAEPEANPVRSKSGAKNGVYSLAGNSGPMEKRDPAPVRSKSGAKNGLYSLAGNSGPMEKRDPAPVRSKSGAKNGLYSLAGNSGPSPDDDFDFEVEDDDFVTDGF